jgi:hypothetical protein
LPGSVGGVASQLRDSLKGFFSRKSFFDQPAPDDRARSADAAPAVHIDGVAPGDLLPDRRNDFREEILTRDTTIAYAEAKTLAGDSALCREAFQHVVVIPERLDYFGEIDKRSNAGIEKQTELCACRRVTVGGRILPRQQLTLDHPIGSTAWS